MLNIIYVQLNSHLCLIARLVKQFSRIEEVMVLNPIEWVNGLRFFFYKVLANESLGLPCSTKILREFYFADWRFFVVCGNRIFAVLDD